jgi:hypothetical protein
MRATSSCHRCRSKAGWRGRQALSGCKAFCYHRCWRCQSDRAACRVSVRLSRRDRQRRAWCGCSDVRERRPHFDGPIPISMLWCARFSLPRGRQKAPLRPLSVPIDAKSISARPPSPCVRFTPRKRTSSARPTMSETCHHRKSVDLLITSSAHFSSTKHLGFASKRPAQFSSSSNHNRAPIVIRSHF